MTDENPLTARLKRYIQVTTAAGGLATRLAGERYLGLPIDRTHHAADLRALLGNLKGPIMKVAQFLATVPGAIPVEYANELMLLQTNAPPMGNSFVRRRMVGELGPQWRQKFAQFEEIPYAAASLGQVHHATTLDGQDASCKLQYPNMPAVIEADLKQLKWVLSTYETFSKALQTEAVQEEITALLHEELDYEREANNCRLYQHVFGNDTNIHVPAVFPELSTARLLTQTYLPGQSLLSLADAPQEQRDILGTRLFYAWYYPLYTYGLLHGDPHPGNYTVRPDNSLNLLDFGCVRLFSPQFIEGVVELYRALQTNDTQRAVHAYEIWGFHNLTSELIDIISHWAKLLYEPLLDDRYRLIQEEENTKGWEIASKVHEALHQAGGIRPPREFVFMDRAAVGIGSVLMRLQAHANWHQLFETFIADFSVPKITKNQKELLFAIPE